jgi:flagellar hook-associated protein 1 FlgK
MNTRPSFSGNSLTGVEMVSISARIDEVLQSRLYERTAQSVYDSDIDQYYQQIIAEFGPLVGSLGLDKQIQRLFSALDDISAQPSSVGIKQIAALEIQETADNLSRLADHLYQMQLDIDQRIYTTTSEVNKLLSDAFTSARTMYGLENGSIERVKSEQDFRYTLEQLAEYIDIYSFTDEMQRWRVFSAQGDALVGDIRYFLKYNPQETMDNFINGASLNPLLISAYSSAGADLNIDHPIVRAAPVGQSETRYDNGRIGALLKVRDSVVPELLSQIDNLAKNIKDYFNKVHNMGSGFPPPNSLFGNTLVGHNDTPGFSGKARIVVVDDAGNHLPSVPALTIDFENLDTGNGLGQPNVHGIMQEIQYHFGNRISLDKSIALGNVDDIKLTSKTKEMNPSSTFVLDLEVTNFSQFDADVEILNVTAQDSLSNNILGSWNNTVSTMLRGTISRTGTSGPSITLNLPGAINYPFIIDMQVRVNDGATDYISTLRYTIASPIVDTVNGLMNYRFSIANKVNALDPGTVKFPALPASVLSTTLVDQYGVNVPVDNTSTGLLRLSTSNSGYRIAIDNLNSKNIGDIFNNVFGNDKNFSSFFGLNDVFVRSDNAKNWNQTKNTALFLQLRPDIAENSALLSSTTLIDTINPSDPTASTYQYHINIGDNSIIREMQSLANKNVFFSSAGGLAAVNTTLSRYTESIISFTANMHDFVRIKSEQSALLKDTIFEKIQNIRGVDVNEEMINMIIFQHSYAASAKIVRTIQDMMSTMISMFN